MIMSGRPASPEQMDRLIGQWAGSGEVFANPFGPAGLSEGTWTFQRDGSGLHLIHDYREVRADGHIFEGHGVFAIDPSTGEFVWYWFDSYGHPPLSPARGRWSGRVLHLEKTTSRGIGRTRFGLQENELVYEADIGLIHSSDIVPIIRAVFHRVSI